MVGGFPQADIAGMASAILTLDDVQVSGDERWRAVAARDRRFDGRFVFAVRTTGIYCRPSCPARRPRPENVAYYPFAEAAERAGFRSCRRCRPREAAVADPRAAAVQRVCRAIEAAPDAAWRLRDVARAAGLSPHHAQRTFRDVLGISPRQYADACRLALFKERLRKGGAVTDATYQAGYGSSSRVYERAPRRLGMTPAQYGRGGQGMRIAFTVAASPLGRLLVAATERGVSAVCLGESDAALAAALREEYPRAELARDDARLADWVGTILRHLRGQEPRLDLPLDIRVTAFERRVYEELLRIPPGQTRSYADVARRIGRPKAVRAVARACASNPVALVVPCHRVVGKDGEPRGYRWGTERKIALLAREWQEARGEAPASLPASPTPRPA
jgi:AraC family transcriptional regulator of adaptative response/methylated-DNA-[protein]-cysteine methyltransferase